MSAPRRRSSTLIVRLLTATAAVLAAIAFAPMASAATSLSGSVSIDGQMFTINSNFEGAIVITGYIDGTRGIITGISTDGGDPCHSLRSNFEGGRGSTGSELARLDLAPFAGADQEITAFYDTAGNEVNALVIEDTSGDDPSGDGGSSGSDDPGDDPGAGSGSGSGDDPGASTEDPGDGGGITQGPGPILSQ